MNELNVVIFSNAGAMRENNSTKCPVIRVAVMKKKRKKCDGIIILLSHCAAMQ